MNRPLSIDLLTAEKCWVISNIVYSWPNVKILNYMDIKSHWDNKIFPCNGGVSFIIYFSWKTSHRVGGENWIHGNMKKIYDNMEHTIEKNDLKTLAVITFKTVWCIKGDSSVYLINKQYCHNWFICLFLTILRKKIEFLICCQSQHY